MAQTQTQPQTLAAAQPYWVGDRNPGPIGPHPWLADMSARLDGMAWEGFAARRLSPSIGAELDGLALADLDDAGVAELRAALLAYKVVVVRAQDLSVDQQLALGRRFGELDVHPFLGSDGMNDEIVRLAKDERTAGYENIWHSDVSWRETPSLGTILRAVEVPEVGGDTLFADMEAALLALDPGVRERIEGRTAVHDFAQSFGQAMSEADVDAFHERFPAVEHPVIRTHPETGRQLLYVNAIFTSHLVGLPADESEELLEVLCRQAAIPEVQCRVRWEPGTVVLWDNRATQHYACSDYWPQARVMERVTIRGERPS